MESIIIKNVENLLPKIKKALNKHQILVVGDVMLDRYWFGDVYRISPEAPVPIAKINKIDDRPGGAANVAKNIAHLGGKVTLLSVVGNDDASHKLEDLLKHEKIETVFYRDDSAQTIVKLRVLAKNQQLIRLDFEEQPSHEILQNTLQIYESLLPKYDVIILSDYGKGGLKHVSKMIELAKQHNKKILIDPKGNDYSKYKDATIITPNKQELREAIGHWDSEEDLAHKVGLLIKNLHLKHLLLTRSEEGMSLFTDNKVYNYPTIAQEVYDVSGAGDTVIATLGLMLTNNIDIVESVQLANIAGGIVVGKLGTATTNVEELVNKINDSQES